MLLCYTLGPMKTISAKTPEKLFTTMTVGLLLLTLILHASLVSAHGGRNDECNDGDDIAPINASLATYTAPLDQIVTGVCIKAGNTPFWGRPQRCIGERKL
ncbi:MAG: hypothetical protein UZ21_OP11001000464 [Microgenomates bacterium OLB22]|nr:MAG: hypothetical protein UZ21_OP11001000464 [Microgenomates bacterium OLB22]